MRYENETSQTDQSFLELLLPRTQNREDSTSKVHVSSKDLLYKGELELGKVQGTVDSAGDQGGRDGVVLQVWTSGVLTDCEPEHDQGGGDETPHHGKAMLQAHESRQDVWDPFICGDVMDIKKRDEDAKSTKMDEGKTGRMAKEVKLKQMDRKAVTGNNHRMGR